MRGWGEPERWLLVFLAVLLLQSAAGLFYPAPEAASGIDVIVRTSAAGIFGYFLSSRAPGRGPRRTLIVAASGLFCLAVLLALRAASVARPMLLSSDSAAATVAQLRDFVSGSVGFLTGGGNSRNEE